MQNSRSLKISFIILLGIGFLLLLSHCQQNPVKPTDYSDVEQILLIRHEEGRREICAMLPDGSDIQVINRYVVGDDYYTYREDTSLR